MIVPYINNIEASREFRNLFFRRDAEERVVVTPNEDIYGYWASGTILQNKVVYISSFMKELSLEVQGISANQATILSYADNIFEGSRPLSEFEGKVLDQTLNRLAKRTPTRPNRG
jgi:hypothetical protein